MSKDSKQGKHSKQSKQTPPIEELDNSFIEDFFIEEEALIGEEKKDQRTSFMKAGHLVDQQLKHYNPNKTTHQMTIFEQVLSNSTKDELEEAGVNREELVYGIRLSTAESNIVDAMCKLLHQKSNNIDPTAKDYFTGTGESMVQLMGDLTPEPQLHLSFYEVAKAVSPSSGDSGKQVQNIAKTMKALSEKNFLMKYTEKSENKKGQKILKEIEQYRPLFYIDKATLTVLEKGEVLAKQSKAIISLNPIFRRQIDSKFIKVPEDLTEKTRIAHGSHRVPEATIMLRDYLLRELSSKRYKPEITEENLLYQVADKYMSESRKSLAKKNLDKALDTVKKLGLVESYKKVDAKTGGKKYVFTLNKDFV